MQTLFSVPKVGLFVDTYHPVKEKRRDDEVMCIRIKFRVQPFDAKLATSIDDGIDAGVRGLLFKLNNPDAKPVIGMLKLKLDCPRQNIELFATPDTDESRLVLLQTKIAGTYARDQKDISGFAFCFDATHGPVDRATLEYVHSLVGKQVFGVFTESEPDLAFSDEEVEDDVNDPPFGTRPTPMFDDEDEQLSTGVEAAKANTTERKREKGHHYPKRGRAIPKSESARKGKKPVAKTATRKGTR